jgi:hypothetical protein
MGLSTCVQRGGCQIKVRRPGIDRGGARGCDLAMLSETLPAAEAGLVKARSIDEGPGVG